MTNELRNKIIDLAASYFANWQACLAALEYDEAREYGDRYEGAMRTAALIGIEESEIKDHAWRKWGDEIGKLYDGNHASV